MLNPTPTPPTPRSRDQIINKVGVNLMTLVENKGLVILNGQAGVDPAEAAVVVVLVV